MANANLPSKLEVLTELAAELNAASDTVNEILAAVERQLVDAHVGIEVWYHRPLTATDAEGSLHGESTVTVTLLGFAKVEGRWCLAIKKMQRVSGFFEGDQSSPYLNEFKVDDPTQLLQASRDLRITALELMPYLIEQLTDATADRIKSITQAKQLIH